jgi:hypothetical protein
MLGRLCDPVRILTKPFRLSRDRLSLKGSIHQSIGSSCTRLFLALPASVSFEAVGCDSP